MRNRLVTIVGDRNWLDISVRIGIDLVLCGCRQLSVLQYASELNCLSASIEIDRFKSGGGYWLDISFCVEIDVSIMRGIEVYLVSVSGSKLARFFGGGENWLCYCLRAENSLVLVLGSTDLVFCVGSQNLLVFIAPTAYHLVYCDGRNWLYLSVGDRTWSRFQCSDCN